MLDNPYPYDMKAVAELGYCPVTGDSWSHILYEEAKALKAEKRYEEALQKFRESYDKDLNYITLHQIGQCYIDMGRHKDAIEPLASATALGANCRPPFHLAVAFHALGDFHKALEGLATSLSRDPTYGPAMRMLRQPDIKAFLAEQKEEDIPGHAFAKLQELGILDKL